MRLHTVRRSFTRKEVEDETQSETQVGTPATMAKGSATDAHRQRECFVLVVDGLGDSSVDTGPHCHHSRYFLLDGRGTHERYHSTFRIPHLG